jgi:hypothetical protein
MLILTPPVGIRLSAEITGTAAAFVAGEGSVLIHEERLGAERVAVSLEPSLMGLAVTVRRAR